ncbi:MAG: phosphoglycolate phosphatase [Gammaproteobacteria bacterium]|jgi:2-phosphoglycolate phosphatase
MPAEIRTVLFDLDGTLADTAPDLAQALNTLLVEQGREPLPYAHIRNRVSHGATALIELGFPEVAGDGVAHLRQRLIDLYAENRHLETRLFPGMEAVLGWLEKKGLSWGVVTNKPTALTEPLLHMLGLDGRAASVVCGDTLENRKPHPDPLLLACNQAGSAAAECVYVGDAQRDVEAAHAAGMPALIALYGYISPDDDVESWRADSHINEPREIVDWLLSGTASLRKVEL